MKFDVVGFGALNIDKLFQVDRIAGVGEESSIKGLLEAAGGSAANTIVGLSRLGLETGYLGKISDDREGSLILNAFKDEGVNLDGIIISKGGTSGVVYCFVDATGERTMYVNPGVNDLLTFRELDKEYCLETKFLHLTSFVGEKPFQAQKQLVRDLKKIQLSLDPGTLYAQKSVQALRPLLKNCAVFFPNERELRLLTNEDYTMGAQRIIRCGAQIVAVKLGARGCYVTNGVEEHLIRAYPVKVVDTTGAGDAFCAGFLFGLWQKKDLYTCGRWGNFVAAQKIRDIGARKGLLRAGDLPPIF